VQAGISIDAPISERFVVRLGVSVLSNLLRSGFSFFTGILVARGLGASGYGDLSFLLGSFAAISHLMEMGTSSAFYTFISQRRRNRAFIVFYLGWIMLQFVATVLVVGMVLPEYLLKWIWVGHERGVVLLSFVASFLVTQAWGMVSQLGEAARRTVYVQMASVFQAVAHLVLVIAAVHLEWLTVPSVLWLLIGEYALLVVILGPRLARENLSDESDTGVGYRAMAGEFVTYCKPLCLYGWVGFLYVFADRWLLQQYGGADQQGFFSIGQQFAGISLIATTSILKVFWKEIADARERYDQRRIQLLYASVSRGLYVVGAWISCLLIPYSREILDWTVGAGYEGAWLCLALMFLYPVHQSLGQIQGTFLYASGETRSYARIGISMMIVSIPITYLVLAPESAIVGGLGLGAVGLAAKEVVLQIVGVNLQAYSIAHSNRWDYAIGYQGLVLGVLLSLAWACKWASQWILGLFDSIGNPSGVIFLGSGLYIVLSTAVLSHFPWIIGLSHDQVRSVLTAVTGRLRPAVA